MLPKTALLDYLLIRSDELRVADARAGNSANYFITALLDAITDFDMGRIPAPLFDKIKLEITEAKEKVKQFSRIPVLVSAKFKNLLKSKNYDSTVDEVMFSKFKFNADIAARTAGDSEINALRYIDLILKEPTKLISEYFICEPKKSSAVDSTYTQFNKTADESGKESRGLSDALDDGLDDDFDIDLDTLFSDEDTGTVKKKSSELEKIVRKTAKIQKSLLDEIFGQDLAINTFVSGYFQSELMAKIKKDRTKPKATFLFAGPPGVGKTFLAEKAAEALALPYRRFDMSEYSEDESNIEFCGSDKVYKNGKVGNVTSFVSENPKCVLLFDEIEKAHLVVIHLFLQILDAGRLRDNFTDEEVSFSDAIIIFTTNAGKNLYENSKVPNLSTIPRKRILKALSSDKHPTTGNPLFPAAICSRFASGNVVMFNHLVANHLFTISKRELDKNTAALEDETGLRVNVDDKVPTAIILAEGGKADARTVKGRTNSFFNDELYELFRLMPDTEGAIGALTDINVTLSLSGAGTEIQQMFVNPKHSEILVFTSKDKKAKLDKHFKNIKVHLAASMAEAKEILFSHNISIVLVDVFYGIQDENEKLLNAEDVKSLGSEFMNYVLSRHNYPVYLLLDKESDISKEEFLSFARLGVREMFAYAKKRGGKTLEERVTEKCSIAYQQSNMLRLAKENKMVLYKTLQKVSADGKVAEIKLFDFKMALATDVEDSKNILDNASKPNVHFTDVIGAEDAKDELSYFVEYLKDPVKYIRLGVRAPRGVLLWGPPGTGKTLLAKAMAGESDVTFLTAEGNQFLKSRIGAGAEAVHDIFRAARKYAPSILFIDEIDAIAKNRGSSAGEYTGDVLTAFLTEMDGFSAEGDEAPPVFVLAATNYSLQPGQSKSLDPALLRRFDRRIYVDLPNKDERRRFLKMKADKHDMIELSDAQIDNIAIRSTGMSLAELDSIIELALRGAIRSDGFKVDDSAFEEAFETFFSGDKREWREDTLLRTARHETGHALISWLAGDKPSYVTIVARGDHGGYMQAGDSEGKGIYTKAEMLSKIRTSLAGRAAEIVYYGEESGVSTGASGDLAHATAVAVDMLVGYGMDDEMGLSYIDNIERTSLYPTVLKRVNQILKSELDEAVRIIESQKEAVDKMVDKLISINRLKENEIDELFTVYVKK